MSEIHLSLKTDVPRAQDVVQVVEHICHSVLNHLRRTHHPVGGGPLVRIGDAENGGGHRVKRDRETVDSGRAATSIHLGREAEGGKGEDEVAAAGDVVSCLSGGVSLHGWIEYLSTSFPIICIYCMTVIGYTARYFTCALSRLATAELLHDALHRQP